MGLALDSSHDLHLSSAGSLATASDGARVVQDVETALRHIRGDWFLNTSSGLPLYDRILSKNPDIESIEFEIRKIVLEVVGVKRVREMSIQFDRVDRTATFTAEIDSVFGDSVTVTV